MLSLSSAHTRLMALVSRHERLPGRLGDMVVPGVWIAGIVVTSLLASWLTGQAWVAVAVVVIGMVVAAWHWVKVLAAAHAALERSERERAAMEQALQRSQKMETLGRLAVGVAHDFNNHLTVISSNVEMLAQRLQGPQERLLRHTEAAIQGVQRAAALTGRLLSFSRQPAPEPEAVDVERLLTGLDDLLGGALGDRIDLDLRLSKQPWFTWADVNQMENALLSLVMNARDQVRSRAKLTIEVSNIRPDKAFQAAYPSLLPREYVLVDVSDPDRLGEPKNWLMADDLNSADLSMARAFVRAFGGILLRSDPAAAGMSLRLFLPRYAPPVPATSLPRSRTSGRSRILVVEDDPAVRVACVGALRELDYEVLEAPDAMEAFRLIADHGGIDLLFTDVGLPGGVSGRALADAARNVDAGIRVLFTTGFERIDLKERGDIALLRKPFSAAQLGCMVRDVLAPQPSVTPSSVTQSAVTQSAVTPSSVTQSAVTQSPATQSPVDQSSVAQSSVAQSSVAQSSVA
jgi:CheY-like chemotaxis protein